MFPFLKMAEKDDGDVFINLKYYMVYKFETIMKSSYNQLSLFRSRRDPLKHFEVSVLRYIRFCRTEENTNRTTKFHIYILTP